MASNPDLTLQIVRQQLRQDLSDTDSSSYRWPDSQLNRTIQRSVERYQQIAPLFQSVTTPTIAGSRVYPIPAGASYVASVEYPTGYYPRRYCSFREYPGNQIEIAFLPNEVPQDTSGTIELVCAFPHTLDSTGTTIPQQHWDVIALGAQIHAIEAYLAQVNDNLDYVDGQFRDRVDDTGAPTNWRAFLFQLEGQYADRLQEIQLQTEQLFMPQIQWGDKPVRWERL